MDRRKSLKVLALGTVSTGVLLEACNTEDKKTKAPTPKVPKGDDKIPPGRMKEEAAHLAELQSETFFTPHEMATITVLSDIIIPKDDVSGNASEAGVPDFIEFMVKEKPEFKTPMRGGLQWMDQQCLKRYERSFKDCSVHQQIELLDQIAYPRKAKPEMAAGVSFFNLMRNLTASGFYTSKIGVKDVGYVGNMPNAWNGVPEDVLNHYDMAYTEKELKECISFDTTKTT